MFYVPQTNAFSSGVALAPKILEPKKSSILIFCRQFSNIEVKQNASKNLDNSTNMCDIKLDEGFIVCYYNNQLITYIDFITLKHNIICTINSMLHVTLEFLAFLAAHLEKASSNLNECSPLSCMLILIMFCRVLMLSLLLMSVLMRFILYYMPYRFMKSIYCWIHKTNKSSCSDIYSAHDFFVLPFFFSDISG